MVWCHPLGGVYVPTRVCFLHVPQDHLEVLLDYSEGGYFLRPSDWLIKNLNTANTRREIIQLQHVAIA